MNSLTIRHLKLPDLSASETAVTARDSIDFVVDGTPLLESLVKVGDGHNDFMGCFVRGFPTENERKKTQLVSIGNPDTEDGRYLLYVCPECGDIGCGAYGARIRIAQDTVEWYDFAYENGYEPARQLSSVGPFTFARINYDATMEAAVEG